MQRRVYLDWNATTPIRSVAREAAVSALDIVGNPSSVHQEGRQARTVVETARGQVAALCGIDPDRITFTSGATEAAALALAGKGLLAAEIEHPAVLAWTQPILPVNACGQVVIDKPDKSTVQLANSETGQIQDLPNGICVTDATQAVGKIPVKQQINRVDFAILSAHKLGGPKGVGAVVVRSGLELSPQLKGGGQEFNRRSGTENLCGIAGFGAAAEEAGKEITAGRWDEVAILRNKLEDMLKDSTENLHVFAMDAPRLPNTSCFAIAGWKGSTQVMLMDLNGFAVSAGSACSSGKVRNNTTLQAFGASEELSNSAIRVSVGLATTVADIENFARCWILEHKRSLTRSNSAQFHGVSTVKTEGK